MIERIFSNWKTTIIGLLILGVALYTIISGIATWLEASPGLAGLYAIFYKKDKKEEEIIKEVEKLQAQQENEINDIRNSSNDELNSKLANWRKRQRKN